MIKSLYFSLLVLVFSIKLFSAKAWENSTWLELMFYERKGSNKYESLVDNPGYFLTVTGKTDPKAEYLAALEKAQAQDPAFKKKFPFRYQWIVQSQTLPYSPIIETDPSIQRLVLSYPTRYMGNPSSIFGHLFLILETDRGYLDSEIYHFMANPLNSSAFGYIWGGLSGAFKGMYLKQAFHEAIKSYSYEDDREIVYYTLDLDQEALQRFQLLTQDLKHANFKYYFMDQNCAYFIGKVLNIVLGKPIVKLNFFVPPSDIINELMRYQLVKKQTQRSTMTADFLQLYPNLNTKQRQALQALLTQRHESMDAFDRPSLKAFLTLSEYVLNNKPYLSSSIRYNRFKAYEVLSVFGKQNIRKALREHEVKPIPSQAFSLMLKGPDALQLNWSPLYFESDWAALDRNRVRVLSPALMISKGEHFKPSLSLLELSNSRAFNSFFGSASWRAAWMTVYDQKLDMDLSFDYGYGRPLWAFDFVDAMLGIRLSSFNPLEQKSLRRLALYPAVSSSARKKVAKRWWLQAAYQYSYNAQYFSVGIHKSWDHFQIKTDYYFSPDTDNWAQVSLQFLY